MALKQGSKWSNWSWDKPVKAFIWRSSRICRPTGELPPWFFEDSLPHLLLRNNSILDLDAIHDAITLEQVIQVVATLLPLAPTIGLHVSAPHHKCQPGKSLQDQHLTL